MRGSTFCQESEGISQDRNQKTGCGRRSSSSQPNFPTTSWPGPWARRHLHVLPVSLLISFTLNIIQGKGGKHSKLFSGRFREAVKWVTGGWWIMVSKARTAAGRQFYCRCVMASWVSVCVGGDSPVVVFSALNTSQWTEQSRCGGLV